MVLYIDQPIEEPATLMPPADGQLSMDQRLENESARRVANALLQEGSVRALYILRDGFRAFAERYPFRCEGPMVKNTGDPYFSYPSEVLERFLYVGTHDSASSIRQLNDLSTPARGRARSTDRPRPPPQTSSTC